MVCGAQRKGGYLQSLSPLEELAVYVESRGHCLLDNGRVAEALDAYEQACRLDLRRPSYQCWRREAEMRSLAQEHAAGATLLNLTVSEGFFSGGGGTISLSLGVGDTPHSFTFAGSRYRNYHPKLGRFLQRDPAEQGPSLYEYVDNNPFVRTDPSGLDYVAYYKKEAEGELIYYTYKGDRHGNGRNEATDRITVVSNTGATKYNMAITLCYPRSGVAAKSEYRSLIEQNLKELMNKFGINLAITTKEVCDTYTDSSTTIYMKDLRSGDDARSAEYIKNKLGVKSYFVLLADSLSSATDVGQSVGDGDKYYAAVVTAKTHSTVKLIAHEIIAHHLTGFRHTNAPSGWDEGITASEVKRGEFNPMLSAAVAYWLIKNLNAKPSWDTIIPKGGEPEDYETRTILTPLRTLTGEVVIDRPRYYYSTGLIPGPSY